MLIHEPTGILYLYLDGGQVALSLLWYVPACISSTWFADEHVLI